MLGALGEWLNSHSTEVTIFNLCCALLSLVSSFVQFSSYRLQINALDPEGRKLASDHKRLFITFGLAAIFFSSLLVVLNERIFSAGPSRIDPGQHIVKPPPRDPNWQKLHDAIDNLPQPPTPAADEAIRSILHDIERQLLTAETDDEKQVVEQAQASLDRLKKSDELLNAFRGAAAKWQSRSACVMRDLVGADVRLGQYERERISDSEYEQDAGILSKAQDLLGWQTRGFTKATPVYLLAGNTQTQVVDFKNRLHAQLAGHLDLVTWQDAALCIDVSDVIGTPIYKRSYNDNAGLQISVKLAVNWLSGSSIPTPTVTGLPALQSGGTDHIEDETYDKATINAVEQVEAQLLGLTHAASAR